MRARARTRARGGRLGAHFPEFSAIRATVKRTIKTQAAEKGRRGAAAKPVQNRIPLLVLLVDPRGRKPKQTWKVYSRCAQKNGKIIQQ